VLHHAFSREKGLAGDCLSPRGRYRFCADACRFRAGAGRAAREGVATGTFSIRFPISYKEVEYQGIETKSGDPKEAASAVHMLTGVDSDGLRFSATEQPLRIPLPPIDSFMETAKRRFEAVESDVQHKQKDGLEILSFTLSEPKQEYFFQVMRGKTSGYVLAVQFPAELRSKASGMKDDFFSSFKIIRQ
jgi:hypothetical protein